MTRPSFATYIYLPVVISAPDGSSMTGPYMVVGKEGTETITGVSRRKPTGFINPTPYYFYKRHAILPHGTCTMGHPAIPWVGTKYVGVVGSGNPGSVIDTAGLMATSFQGINLSDDEGLRSAALTAVRLKLKSTSVNLGVAFGERKQTARLLGDTATRLAKSYRALRHGEIRKSMRELGLSSRAREPRGGNVPSKWLELQYGWKPLLSDVYGAAKALENRPKGDWRVTAKATRSKAIQSVVTHNGQGAATCSATGKKSVFCRIDALPLNEATISLASLGVTNPLLIGWELVPFSFVVDWALPVGDFLESLDAMLGYGSTVFSSSYLVKANYEIVGRITTQGPYYIQNNCSGAIRDVLLDRQVSTTVPLPSLPRFKDPRSLGHMANGLSLLAQAFGR